MDESKRERERYRAGDLVIDADSRQVSREGRNLRILGLSFDLLLALIRAAPGIVSIPQLMDRVWPDRVVNPETVSQRIKLLRDALGDDSHDPRYIAAERSRGYYLAVPVERIDDEEAIPEPNGTATGSWWAPSHAAVISAVVLVIALVTLAVFLTTEDQNRGRIAADEPRRIAVLPFEHGKGEADEDFADGLTEELINALVQLEDLRVTARTSAFHFKGKPEPVTKIADELGVDYVVEGMVRRSGEDLRISAQLIRADQGFHMWSRTYDRKLTDLFDVQHDIAERVAESLGILLDDEKRRRMRLSGINNVQAYAAYRNGREFYLRAHGEQSDQRIELLMEANTWFDRAIEREPDFAEAYLSHADLYAHLLIDNVIDRPIPPRAETIVPHAADRLKHDWNRAYQAADTPGRRISIDIFRTVFFGRWAALPEKIEQLTMTHDCPIPWWFDDLMVLGLAEEVAAYTRKLTDCDPLNYGNWWIATEASIWAGSPELALETGQRGMETLEHPRIAEAYVKSLVSAGDYRKARRVIAANVEPEATRLRLRVLVLAARGKHEKARQLADRYMEDTDGKGNLIPIHAWLGDRASANAAASRFDARELGPKVLLTTTHMCLCGAPFDLDAAPNFKKRIEEAGIAWPTRSPIDFPAKDW